MTMTSYQTFIVYDYLNSVVRSFSFDNLFDNYESLVPPATFIRQYNLTEHYNKTQYEASLTLIHFSNRATELHLDSDHPDYTSGMNVGITDQFAIFEQLNAN